MIACKEFTDLLGAYVGNDLSAEQREEVACHLAHCPHCRTELDRYQLVIQLTSQLPDVPPPPSLLERFNKAVQAENDRPATGS
jgi:anti-sigma factor RsiW